MLNRFRRTAKSSKEQRAGTADGVNLAWAALSTLLRKHFTVLTNFPKWKWSESWSHRFSFVVLPFCCSVCWAGVGFKICLIFGVFQVPNHDLQVCSYVLEATLESRWLLVIPLGLRSHQSPLHIKWPAIQVPKAYDNTKLLFLYLLLTGDYNQPETLLIRSKVIPSKLFFSFLDCKQLPYTERSGCIPVLFSNIIRKWENKKNFRRRSRMKFAWLFIINKSNEPFFLLNYSRLFKKSIKFISPVWTIWKAGFRSRENTKWTNRKIGYSTLIFQFPVSVLSQISDKFFW